MAENIQARPRTPPTAQGDWYVVLEALHQADIETAKYRSRNDTLMENVNARLLEINGNLSELIKTVTTLSASHQVTQEAIKTLQEQGTDREARLRETEKKVENISDVEREVQKLVGIVANQSERIAELEKTKAYMYGIAAGIGAVSGIVVELIFRFVLP